LAFRRGTSFACVVNLSSRPVAVPVDGSVVLSSGDPEAGLLPPDTTAWLVR
jgi:alpha-glucosidase